ncbi:MurR/RpiR family transcriptional regulator [Spelaeicoccus albus]|uniref:DNA-binding MurR/RpiR family transcriptional regulator n=1 Tax=Spelaeicoccus albus TaxID=1280376 RepID=A0A7Z0IIT6_9MICO|nr:MurR/RpiR family transcriptional regulator [Spelaeicoccus albus]NYI68794.1 DNA-binding MurR/RpiR family transcriptional regulator [Spelaeicoccus albus]
METQSAPTSYGELRSTLQQQLPQMAAGQKRIATLLLTDPEGTAFRTIAETATLAEVHQSSVVRFATSIGLKGYPSIVQLCRDYFNDQAHLIRRFDQNQGETSTSGLLSSVVDHEQQNLSRTFARLDRQTWEGAVALLAEGPNIHVMGLRKCLPVSQILTYLLHLVRPNVYQVAPIVGSLVDQIRDFNTDDIFVGISTRRYTSDTISAFHEATSRGLKTIALTDNAASPMAATADFAFFIDSQGVHVLPSITALVSTAQTLATAVASRLGAESRSELVHDEELLESLNVYTDKQPLDP